MKLSKRCVSSRGGIPAQQNPLSQLSSPHTGQSSMNPQWDKFWHAVELGTAEISHFSQGWRQSIDKDGCCQSGRWLTWLNVSSGSSVLVGRLAFRLTAILILRLWGPFRCAPEWDYHSCVLPGSVLNPFLREKCPFWMLSECFRKLCLPQNLLMHSGITPAPFSLLSPYKAPDTLGLSLNSEGKTRIFLFQSIFLKSETFKCLSHP